MSKKDKHKIRDYEKTKGVSKIGENCRIFGEIDKHNRHLVEMGNNIIIGNNSMIVLHGPIRPYRENNKIILEDFVWIGRRCIILPGVRIGRCSIIGAMSLVCGDIPSYSVAAGNPCKVIRRLKALELLRTFVIKKERKILGEVQPDWSLLTMDDVKEIMGFGTDNCFDPVLDGMITNMTVYDILDYYMIQR